MKKRTARRWVIEAHIYAFGDFMRIAIYARVSTVEQKSIEAQLEELRRYAEQRGWTVVEAVGEQASGAKDKRPGRQGIIDLAEKRKIDGVLVWKLDRWGRSTIDLLNTLKRLNELGVAFVSYQEAIDTSSAMGRMLTTFLSAFAQYERDCISERTKLGIAHLRKKNGGAWGRPPRARARTERVAELDREGKTTSQIAQKLGLGASSVRRIKAALKKAAENTGAAD